MENDKLSAIALRVRRNIIKMVNSASSGHPGGSLSGVEIAVLLYFEIMNIPSFSDENRDKFILSKGHASPLLYAVLCEKGLFPAEELLSFRRLSSRLQGHPDMKKLPGVEMTTGSLGLGIGAAVGMALSAKSDGKPNRIYCLCGDGEIQEGTVWEAAMAASHYKLDNFTLIIDNNGLQIDGDVAKVMSPYPIDEKLRAFGFEVVTAENGNCFDCLREAIGKLNDKNGKPKAIVAKTVKGKGVSFMENNASWHGTAPNEEQTRQALKELGEN
ncbi:MAG: transketolase [Eubacteriaceae bacterium]|nr:transketolase [Eubacteriaceae bacterium]